MKINLKKLFAIACALVWIAFLNGCHTMAGLGKDVQQGGAALEKVAKTETTE